MDINKEKCRILKQVRKKLADALQIDLHQRECTYEGPCSGTCPKCRQEEQILNQALLKRTTAMASVGMLSVGMLVGCQETEIEGTMPMPLTEATEIVELEGDMEYIPSEEPEYTGEEDEF